MYWLQLCTRHHLGYLFHCSGPNGQYLPCVLSIYAPDAMPTALLEPREGVVLSSRLEFRKEELE